MMPHRDLLRPYFAESRTRILLGLASLVLVDLLQLAIPRVIKHAVDDLASAAALPGRLAAQAGTILALAVLVGLFRYVWRLCLLGTSRRVEQGLRERLFDHLQRLSAAYFDRTATGDLMARATHDLQQIRMAAGMGIVALNDAVVMGAAAIAFMAYIDPVLTAWALVPMPLLAFGTRVFSRRMHRRYRAVQASFAELTEAIRERIVGVRLIQAHNLQTFEAGRVEASSREFLEENLKLVRVTGVFSPLMLLLTNVSLVLVLLVGGRRTILAAITPGDLVAFITYLGLLAWPMMALGWVTNLVQRGKASLERIAAVLAEAPQVASPPSARPLPRARGEIVFEAVSFRYAGTAGRPALEGIDLEVPAGAVLGIVGPPGAGKSTLLSLVPRLYDPAAGRIRLDGHDLRELRLEDLRRAVCLLPQDAFLFSGTLRDNLTLGDPGIAPRRLEEAAAAAALLDTVRGFPAGFDTVVGERGVMLSGGQKQRVALARCLLAESPVLLLDDPVSQVDFETAAAIVRALRALAGRRTILIASHRLAAVEFADRILVLDGGRRVALGTHRELLRDNPYYARAFRLQELEEAAHAA